MARAKPEPQESTTIEGEPQTVFLPPDQGGSYVRNADGSLTRKEHPTLPPGHVRERDGTPRRARPSEEKSEQE